MTGDRRVSSGTRNTATSLSMWRDLPRIVRQVRACTSGSRRQTLLLLRDYWTLLASAHFDRAYYLSANPDVAASGMDPLLHFIWYGEAESRKPTRALSRAVLARIATRAHGTVSGSPLAAYARGALPELAEHERVPFDICLTRLPEVVASKRDDHRSVVVYTAIFDDYDVLRQPVVVNAEVDYVCFSDREMKDAGCWQVRSPDFFHTNPRRAARYVKMHPHVFFPHHEWSIWIDGRASIRVDPLHLIDEYGQKGPLHAYLHPDRELVAEEAEAVIEAALDSPEIVRAQVARNHARGMPVDAPLHETNVLLRRHRESKVMAHSQVWYEELQQGSVRDQLSFDFAAWRTGLRVNSFGPRPLNVRNDARFVFAKHATSVRNAVGHTRASRGAITPPPLYPAPIANAASVECADTDIVICVHDALPDVIECLHSVDLGRMDGERLIVVDDGSSHSTAAWLSTHVGLANPRDRLIRRDEAGGYTVAANTGLRASTAPFVVLLNSDTVVPSGWLRKLRRAAASGPCIGLVGPLSNAAGYQSVPLLEAETGGFAINAIPSPLTVADLDALCGRIGQGLYPRVPVINGFCMLVSRPVIEAAGYFDEVAFPKGYGEETDYCFRAWAIGHAAVVACDTYVFHAKSRSYTTARRNVLAAEASITLERMWSPARLRSAAATLEQHPWLAKIREEVATNIASASAAG